MRVGNKVYVIGGYQTLCTMGQRMQILDIGAGTWSYGPPLPPGFPKSHAGIASDGHFLFVVSGQPGPACEPATNLAWALDLETLRWLEMAPLPAARYTPCVEYVDGCLHAISGATEDRVTVCDDHLILRIREPDSPGPLLPNLEDQVWRQGPPIPKGGDHAGSLVLEGRIYVIGGEHGHAPVTMDASKCCGTYWAHDHLFRYDPREERWETLAGMPVRTSHIEGQIVPIDGRIVVFGGTGDRDVFVDTVQAYDPARDRWEVLSQRLPAPRKGGVVWEKEGILYFNGGQVSLPDGERPVVAETMTAAIERGWLARLGEWAR
jgi:Kelch motif